MKKKIFLFCFVCLNTFAFSSEKLPIFLEESVQKLDLIEKNENLYDLYGLDLLQKEKMPKHISFIMDGNRRWAKLRGLSEIEGHAKGAETVIKLLKFFNNTDLGVDTITLYAFSTENWKRSETEVNLLMELFITYFDEIFPYLQKFSISLKTIGDLTRLPLELQKKIQNIKDFPIEDPKFTLVIGLNYGGRDEIKRAFSHMALDLERGVFSKEDITEELIQNYLDTSSINDPELMIRTSGEMRISNFLLWQIAYSELYFSSSLWPDISEQELVNILLDFQKRDRRLGGTSK